MWNWLLKLAISSGRLDAVIRAIVDHLSQDLDPQSSEAAVIVPGIRYLHNATEAFLAHFPAGQ